MNIEELADYLRLRKQTIYNWLHQKKISGIKVGGVWRFDKKEVDSWLRARRLSCINRDPSLDKVTASEKNPRSSNQA
jgi:excisionase family DNA binding protein